jgi:hypothetical protein
MIITNFYKVGAKTKLKGKGPKLTFSFSEFDCDGCVGIGHESKFSSHG